MQAVLFFIGAFIVLSGALGVLLFRNPVHCALSLVGTLIGIALLFLLQDAVLVAVVQIIVYASAIVVLFLFVIMLLGVDRTDSVTDSHRFQKLSAVLAGAVVLAGLLVIGGTTWVTGQKSVHLPIHGGSSTLGSNVSRVARVIFTDYLWPFELTAALLTIAVVGTIILAQRQHSNNSEITEPTP